MRYYVLRNKNEFEDTCEICIAKEEEINSQGGGLFSPDDIMKCATPDYRGVTGLFHPHCRCTLIESPDGIPIYDDLDTRVIFQGALSHIYYKGKSPEEKIKMVVRHV